MQNSHTHTQNDLNIIPLIEICFIFNVVDVCLITIMLYGVQDLKVNSKSL